MKTVIAERVATCRWLVRVSTNAYATSDIAAATIPPRMSRLPTAQTTAEPQCSSRPPRTATVPNGPSPAGNVGTPSAG